MPLAVGAVSSALDALQSLTSPTFPQTTGFTQSSTNPFDNSSSSIPSRSQAPVAGGNGFTQISSPTMSALLAAQGQSSTATAISAPTSPSSALQDLFAQLDANGDGQISKSALGAGGTNIAQADDMFSKLDKNGDGSVSLEELSSALKGGRVTITTIMSPVRTVATAPPVPAGQAPASADRAPIRCCRH
jgi:Ca2+-binding EF-hand superfamily protein